MLGQTWIAVTGQRWKFRIGLVLLGLSVVSFVAAVVVGTRSDVAFGVGMFAFAFLFVASLVWTNVAICCPFCRGRIVWAVLRTRRHQDALQLAFYSLTHCPRCGRAFAEVVRRGVGR